MLNNNQGVFIIPDRQRSSLKAAIQKLNAIAEEINALDKRRKELEALSNVTAGEISGTLSTLVVFAGFDPEKEISLSEDFFSITGEYLPEI